MGRRRCSTPLADPPGTWVVQERIPVRREVFPQFDDDRRCTMRDMLVDFAPYLFRGRMGGYLTRLSDDGARQRHSGGGQVPAFVVVRAEGPAIGRQSTFESLLQSIDAFGPPADLLPRRAQRGRHLSRASRPASASR